MLSWSNWQFSSKLILSSSFCLSLTLIFEASNQSTAGKLTKAKNTSSTLKSFLKNILPCLTVQLPPVGLQTECPQVLDKPPRLTIALPKLWTPPNPTWPDHCLHPLHKFQDQVKTPENSKLSASKLTLNFQWPPTLAEMVPEISWTLNMVQDQFWSPRSTWVHPWTTAPHHLWDHSGLPEATEELQSVSDPTSNPSGN